LLVIEFDIICIIVVGGAILISILKLIGPDEPVKPLGPVPNDKSGTFILFERELADMVILEAIFWLLPTLTFFIAA
jgi:hypothetical protein